MKRLIGIVAVFLLLIGATSSADADTTLRRGIRYEPASLDPHKYNTQYEAWIVLDLFEGLLTFGPDGKPVPGVAAKWGSSPDGRTWTFTLRPNLTWSDGQPLTAEDVVQSFRRLLDPKTAANYAPLFYVIKNARAVNTGTAPVETLGVSAPSPDTVELRMDTPTPYLPQLLANGFAAIVPRHVIAQHGDAWVKAGQMVGNGAFTLTQWSPQDRVVLTRNPHYRDAAKVKLDQVVYFPSADLDAAVSRFRAGDLDLQSGFPSSRMNVLTELFPTEVRVVPALDIFYLALNTTNPKLSDVRVRRALSLAIDRDLLVDKVMRDGALPALNLVPPDVSNYVPATMDFRDTAMPDRLEQARKLLSEAGYGPSTPLNLVYSHSTVGEMKRIGVAIAAMWQRIGVDVRLQGTEGKVMFANMRQGNYEVAYAGWSADFDDAASFLYLLQSSSIASNYSRYANKKFDGLLASAAGTADAKKRAALLRQAEEIALADQPLLPVAFGVSKSLVRKNVDGWQPNAADVHLSRYLSVTGP